MGDLVAWRMKQVTRFVQKKIHSSCFQTNYAKWRSHKEIFVQRYRTFSHVPRDSDGKCVCVCACVAHRLFRRAAQNLQTTLANWTPNSASSCAQFLWAAYIRLICNDACVCRLAVTAMCGTTLEINT